MPSILAATRKLMTWMAVTAALLLGLASLATEADERRQTTQGNDFLEGQLLVATPKMGDPRFVESVIYMVKHNSEGAMGLVLNRLIGVGPLSDLLEGFGVDGKAGGGDIRVHYGGPVHMQSGFVLHSTDYVVKGTLIVNDLVALTTNLDILTAIATGDGPRESLFALGYAGWGPGQLEGEIKADAWFSIPADEKLVFDHDLDHKWQRALAKRSVDL